MELTLVRLLTSYLISIYSILRQVYTDQRMKTESTVISTIYWQELLMVIMWKKLKLFLERNLCEGKLTPTWRRRTSFNLTYMTCITTRPLLRLENYLSNIRKSAHSF